MILEIINITVVSLKTYNRPLFAIDFSLMYNRSILKIRVGFIRILLHDLELTVSKTYKQTEEIILAKRRKRVQEILFRKWVPWHRGHGTNGSRGILCQVQQIVTVIKISVIIISAS